MVYRFNVGLWENSTYINLHVIVFRFFSSISVYNGNKTLLLNIYQNSKATWLVTTAKCTNNNVSFDVEALDKCTLKLPALGNLWRAHKWRDKSPFSQDMSTEVQDS